MELWEGTTEFYVKGLGYGLRFARYGLRGSGVEDKLPIALPEPRTLNP